jgi:hypothetical protein
MAKRTRTTITVREDNPVPKRRTNRKKKQSGAIVIGILTLLLMFLVFGNRQSHPQQRQNIAVRGR